MHHARATQISFPTGCPASRERIASTMKVTGWFSAKARTGPGIEVVGTKAELINGRKMIGYEKAPAPSTDFAVRPAIAAIHVRASVNSARIPATASQDNTPADVDKLLDVIPDSVERLRSLSPQHRPARV